MKSSLTKKRCSWPGSDPLYVTYHDEEWGVPVHEDRKLFEFLVLDGAQAGLSWITILRKRENYRQAFDQFEAQKIARYNDKKIQELLQDAGIVRNRLKVRSAVLNAQAFLKIQEQFRTFDRYIWQFTGGQTLIHHWQTMKDIPASTKESDAMSRDLKSRGFTFVGTTICYAFMQAAGLVNDHFKDCFRWKECQK